MRAAADNWTGEEPENFAMVALTAATDPGLLVLPIHRVTTAEAPVETALDCLREVFDVQTAPDLDAALVALSDSGGTSLIGLAATGSDEIYLLSPERGRTGCCRRTGRRTGGASTTRSPTTSSSSTASACRLRR